MEQEPLLIWLMRFLNRWDDLEIQQDDGSFRAFKWLSEKEKVEYLIEEIMRRYL